MLPNPDLNNPMNGNSGTVPSLTRFKHKNEFGEVVESFAPMDNKRGAIKYYVSSHAHMKMHRWDGTPIPFVDGFFETDVIATQMYLDGTIADGIGYIAVATEDQVHMMKMKRDPRGTITAEVRDRIEQETRDKLEAQIRAEVTDDVIRQLADHEKLKGVDGFAEALAGVNSQKVDGATIIMRSQAAPLGGIVSTANLAGNAAGSTSGSLSAAELVAAAKAGKK